MSIKIEPYLRKYNKLKSGECPIYIRVYIEGKNHWVNLEESVVEKNWNKKAKYEPIKKTYFRRRLLTKECNKNNFLSSFSKRFKKLDPKD